MEIVYNHFYKQMTQSTVYSLKKIIFPTIIVGMTFWDN